jgi:PAS domain S-box-containing protein
VGSENQELYHSFFQHAPVAFYRTSPEGKIVAANRTLQRLLGYPSRVLQRMNAAELYADPGDRAQWQLRIERKGVIHGLKTQLRRRDGSRIWVKDTARAVKDAQGNLLYYDGMLEDITEWKRAEEAGQALEERYRHLFEHAGEAVYTMSLSGDFLSLNPALERITGYPRDELLGVSFRKVVAPEYQSLVRGMIEKKLQGKRHTRYELDIICKDGSRRSVETDSWLQYVDGHPVCIQAIARDITEHKRAEAIIAQQTRQLAQSNAELEQFASTVSHDLQEPLRMVRSFAELLAERYHGRLDSDGEEFLGYIVDGARRMQEMIRALLQYSRITTRGRPLAPTDVEAVLERVLHDLRPSLEEAEATVTRDPLPVIMADAVQLGQLLQNLISNAAKFRSGNAPRIHIGCEKRGHEWIFSVSDNGIGIDPDDSERIFRVFERGKVTAHYPGTGVGLAICKKTVERHGGRIWVESKPGEGATFHFALPAERKGDA